MRKATINDIAMELWLRERNDRELRWVTKEGKEFPIRDMSIEHLRNIMNKRDDYERSLMDRIFGNMYD